MVRGHTRDIVTLVDRDAGLHNGIVFHIAHRHHVVDLRDTEPVQDVGHERLEAHVLHASNDLCRLEVLVRRITTALAKIVHKVPMQQKCY